MWDVLAKLVNADTLGGWVRAFVASVLATAVVKYPILTDFLDPQAQLALGVVLSSVVVGVWSTVAKKRS